MKLTANFDIKEFVPESIYIRYGSNSIWFMDRRIIMFSQWLRDYVNSPITVNNWHTNGLYNESGFRIPSTSTGAYLSQHKYGRAVDLKVNNCNPDNVIEIIRKNFERLNLNFGISTIETNTPTWVHVDCRVTGLNTLKEIEL